MALAALPSYSGKLYRGINCRFDTGTYTPGNTICWPSFSSASRCKAVAEEFSKGDEGSLFFLHSETAKSIDGFSRFPDEAEVLFRVNTVFEITSWHMVRVCQILIHVLICC